MEKIEYSYDEIESVLSQLSNFFDIVRIVNPVTRIVYRLENGRLIEEPFSCHHVWHKGQRCDNCISSRCLVKCCRYMKYEFIDKDVFQVTAQYIKIDGNPYVLEVVSAISNDVLFDAFGQNDFVDQITNYNHQIYLDSLTGVSNRRCLDDKFLVLLDECKYEKVPLGIAMVDIDDFKEVNDSYGHVQGDTVIKHVAETLRKNFSRHRGDMVVRYGGDEFFVAVKNMPLHVFMERLAYIQKCISDLTPTVSISVGVYYMSNVHDTDVENIINNADKALYAIKATEKGGILVY